MMKCCEKYCIAEIAMGRRFWHIFGEAVLKISEVDHLAHYILEKTMLALLCGKRKPLSGGYLTLFVFYQKSLFLSRCPK